MRYKGNDSGITVLRADDCIIADADWGELRWHANDELGNSLDMTVGRCVLKPGKSNPRHLHPNCSEVLVVISGAVSHSTGNGDNDQTSAELFAGDTVTIPKGVPHQACNLSNAEEAIVFIAFSSADRQTELVD